MSRERAITRLEVLVVLVCVLVLVVVIQPVVGIGGREHARRTVCGTNMRLILGLMTKYLSDNNDRFYECYQGSPLSPASREAGQGGIPANVNVTPDHPDYEYYRNHEDWRPLNEYVDVYDIWKCPSDAGRVDFPDHVSQPLTAVKPTWWKQPALGASYLFNTAGIPRLWSWPFVANINPNISNNVGHIMRPSEFVVFYEIPFLDLNYEVPVTDPRFVHGSGFGHGGSSNFHEPYFAEPSSIVGFADGHVSRLVGFQGQGKRVAGLYEMVPE